MKNYLLIAAGFCLFAPTTSAANLHSISSNDLDKNHIETFSTLSIKADQANEISAQKGIHILLDKEAQILWNNEAISFSGSAVVNGRVAAKPLLTFSSDYKILNIPLLADFLPGEELKIDDLKVRTYGSTFGKRYLGLDINGDSIAEALDENYYRVIESNKSDNTIPYPVSQLKYAVSPEKTVTLNWLNSPDYDIDSIQIEKNVTLNGMVQNFPLFHKNLEPQFIDPNLKTAEKVSYLIKVKDFNGHESEVVELNIDLNAKANPEVTPPMVPQENNQKDPLIVPTATPTDVEVKTLNRLLNYYYLRYQIHCKADAQSATSDVCLLSRVNLFYAQKFTERILEPLLQFSDKDLDQLTMNLNVGKQQYEKNCLNISTPAPYCPWLKNDLTRSDYLLTTSL